MSSQASPGAGSTPWSKLRIMGGPGRYIQGPGALDHLGSILGGLGQKPLVIADRIVWGLLGQRVRDSLAQAGLEPVRAEFGGECCLDEIERISALAREAGVGAIVGLGGGKTIDTAKAVSLAAPVPLIIAPTIASNDAPCSRVIVIYGPAGDLREVRVIPFNPLVVLVDTAVIARAPARFLVSGMGDALSTKFEADQTWASGGINKFEGSPCRTALVLADACYDLVRRHGLGAKEAAERQEVTEDLEAVIEANIYLSGLGFESGGLAAAHGLTRGLSRIEELHGCLHGEEVAFGTLVQLVLEGRSDEFMADLIGFYRQIGLPATLADLGLKRATEEHLRAIAEPSCAASSPLHQMARPVSVDQLVEALRRTEALGREISA